jgi:hypothetical protein
MQEPDTFVPPRAIAKSLGVTPRTVARWADDLTEGVDYIRTAGGHRRIAAHVVEQWRKREVAA